MPFTPRLHHDRIFHNIYKGILTYSRQRVFPITIITGAMFEIFFSPMKK